MREVPIREAPEPMRAYLAKLTKSVGYCEPINVAVIAAADMPPRMGVTDNAHGFLRLSPGDVPLIVISDAVLETDRWQFIVAHEFLHLFRWSIDGWVLGRLPDHEHEPYMRHVEDTMKPLTILLMVAGMVNAEWVDKENRSD